jgi:hypothetical protein
MMNTPIVHAAEVIAAYGGSAEEMVRRRDEQCPMGRMGDAWPHGQPASEAALRPTHRRGTGVYCIVDIGG